MYNINFWLSFCDSFLFCFVFSFYLTYPTRQVVFALFFLKRVFVSQRLHCGINSGVSGSKTDDRPQWTQMSGSILHGKYGISTGEQHERFSLQNNYSVIWESRFWSSLGTSGKNVRHRYWKLFSSFTLLKKWRNP